MDQTQKSYKDTLNLPHTDFPIRSNPAVEDPALLERWQTQDLYNRTFQLNAGNPKYILHDGPPYANGHIHLGHAYNKILKDIVTKSHRMMGFHVPVTPGWDCHGLPIELKVEQENPTLKRDALIAGCRAYAQHWISVQREEFKRLGVLMDWEHPYVTMSPYYEAATIKAFGMLVADGYIERKNKTVPWCMHCHTVLASAEIEYKDRKDPSIYVAFDLSPADAARLFPTINSPISVVVWTTTPWTLPLNEAVLAKANTSYALVSVQDRYILVGDHVAEKVMGLLTKEGTTSAIIERFNSDKLAGLKLFHPFVNKQVPLLFDDSVELKEGTAFIHCAPGCGPSDYEIGVKNRLDIYSPITAHGHYSSLIEPKELEGKPVTEGQGWVIAELMRQGKLLHKGSITHSYPHCWRCRNGLIFRATPQWFFDLEKNNIKERVLEGIETINFVPPVSKNFLKATVENRWEWCLSRQRTWGTPIPALLCVQCDTAYLDNELIEHVAHQVAKEGIEYWQRVSVQELKPNFVCTKCGSNELTKEYDILDVWFDAGVSHYAVLYKNPALAFPADLYLEGIDQHRGWFQSSLIMSTVIEQEPCMRGILTHGYTVDEKGQKMSKSLGNVVSPDDLIKRLGTDGLRLWVSSIGHSSDPVVSERLVQNVAEVQRKVRNTARFLLQNLYDFDYETDAVTPEQLLPIDFYALATLAQFNQDTISAYKNYDLTAVFHGLSDYCANELSSFYLDIVKDRLYCGGSASVERRSAQTVLWHLLDTLTRLMAPVLSFTAEQLSDYAQKKKKESIHLQPFVDPVKLFNFCFPASEPIKPAVIIGSLDSLAHEQLVKALFTQWRVIKDVRDVLLKAIEGEREKGVIKHSLEAQLTLSIDWASGTGSELKAFFKHLPITPEAFLQELLIVSQVNVVAERDALPPSSDKNISVSVSHAAGKKCPRCWQYSVTDREDGLNLRCQKVLGL